MANENEAYRSTTLGITLEETLDELINVTKILIVLFVLFILLKILNNFQKFNKIKIKKI